MYVQCMYISIYTFMYVLYVASIRTNVVLQIQVSHLEPQTISLKGEGVFPTLLLSCPRYQDPEGVYDSLKEKAMVVLQEREPTSQPLDEKHTRPEYIVCDSSVGILESGIPQVESFLDLHVSRQWSIHVYVTDSYCTGDIGDHKFTLCILSIHMHIRTYICTYVQT